MNTQQALLHARSLDIEPIDAQTLLLQVIQRSLHDRAWLLLNDTFELSIDQQAQFQQGLERLMANEPLAYLTGWQAFHGLELQVTTDAQVYASPVRKTLEPFHGLFVLFYCCCRFIHSRVPIVHVVKSPHECDIVLNKTDNIVKAFLFEL